MYKRQTTNHEENNYGLFSLSADAGTASGSNLLFYATVGIAILGIYLQYKSWKASSKRRDRKAKSSPKTVRSRRVVLDNPPNRNAGTNRGQATSVPLYDPQSWRNPGGPIGPPAGDKAAGYAAAKSDNARKHADPNGRAGRNVRRQHPYAGHKHATKGPAKHQHPRQNAVRNASLQQASVNGAALHSTPKSKPTPYSRKGKSDKAEKNASRHVLRVPLRRGGGNEHL